YVIFGGDKLLPQKLSGWLEMYSLNDIQLINMYGITETTVHVTHYSLAETDIRSPYGLSLIGIPLPETTLYIMDKFLKPLPIGIPGEMFVGGTGVSPGYLNQVELTRQRFLPSPHKPGEILYKSGDLGRRLSDGDIEYLGRNDNQVKIRGFRIEPTEIENQLLQHSHIKEAVVIPREDNNQQIYLCAYISLVSDESTAQIREYLADRMPHYMIPSYFVPVNNIPLTPNGKVD
ncbi:MAG: amino acid adenylation domain-containing protein, partial [bacterium]|nr:amino acid adenylation domain-containing protein [bacterium]